MLLEWQEESRNDRTERAKCHGDGSQSKQKDRPMVFLARSVRAVRVDP